MIQFLPMKPSPHLCRFRLLSCLSTARLLVPAGCVVGVFLLGGCTSRSPEVGQLSAEQAAELNASRSTFDSATPPPIKPQTHLAAGRLAESRGDLTQAASQYRRALRQNPDDLEALFRLGTLLSKQSSPDAPKVWQQYVEATGGSATAWANLGFSHELLGSPQEAEKAYRRGIASDSDNASCRVNYGLLLARQGEIEDASDQLMAALPPEEAWYNIGSVSERQGEAATAISAYRKALTHQPEFAAAQQRLDSIIPQNE